MYDSYVLDVTIYDGDGTYGFCPVEFDTAGNVSRIVVGMTYVSDLPPHGARLVGVIHSDGQEACDSWCSAHEEELEAVFAASATAAAQPPEVDPGPVRVDGEAT